MRAAAQCGDPAAVARLFQARKLSFKRLEYGAVQRILLNETLQSATVFACSFRRMSDVALMFSQQVDDIPALEFADHDGLRSMQRFASKKLFNFAFGNVNILRQQHSARVQTTALCTIPSSSRTFPGHR